MTNELATSDEPIEEARRLIFTQLAESDRITTRNLPMLLHVARHHLFLLNGIETCLPNVGARFTGFAVETRTERVGTPLLDAVRLGKSGLYETFEYVAGRGEGAGVRGRGRAAMHNGAGRG